MTDGSNGAGGACAGNMGVPGAGAPMKILSWKNNYTILIIVSKAYIKLQTLEHQFIFL